MAKSIIHRGTGMAMYFGTLLIVLWLGAAALGDGPFGVINAIYGFWLVQVILFLATWALFHHLLGGIRHFVWDTGNLARPGGPRDDRRGSQLGGLDRPDARRLGAVRVVQMIDKADHRQSRRRITASRRRRASSSTQRITGGAQHRCSRSSSSGSWCGSPAPTARRWSSVVRNPFVAIVLVPAHHQCVHPHAHRHARGDRGLYRRGTDQPSGAHAPTPSSPSSSRC